MKIAYDAKRLFHNHTGLGNYSRTLVNDMLEYHTNEVEISLFSSKTQRSDFLSHFESTCHIVDPSPKFSSYWRSYSISKDINTLKPDIYHGLSNELPFTSNRINAVKIVTIHDLFYEKFPKDFSVLDRKIYKYKTERACADADHIIAISEATKSDIVKFLGVKPEKIKVIYQSCNRVFQSKQSASSKYVSDYAQKLPQEFALFVGTLNDRKNISGLLKAMALIPGENRLPLVVVGSANDSKKKELSELIESSKLSKDVFLLGNLKNQDLLYLYRNALFTCLPSFYEGFGIPVIESLFCNTPVLVSNVSSLPEAAGLCGEKCDPSDINSIKNAYERLSSDENLRKKYISSIDKHLDKFTSQNVANELNDFYMSV